MQHTWHWSISVSVFSPYICTCSHLQASAEDTQIPPVHRIAKSHKIGVVIWKLGYWCERITKQNVLGQPSFSFTRGTFHAFTPPFQNQDLRSLLLFHHPTVLSSNNHIVLGFLWHFCLYLARSVSQKTYPASLSARSHDAQETPELERRDKERELLQMHSCSIPSWTTFFPEWWQPESVLIALVTANKLTHYFIFVRDNISIKNSPMQIYCQSIKYTFCFLSS